jgi:hypothetical protein
MQQSRLSLIPAHPRRRIYIQHHNMVDLASRRRAPLSAKDPQVYPIYVHAVLGASVREAWKRVSGRQQADSMQYLGFELLRTHQPVEKVVVGPVGGPKQGQNTTERRFESLIRG